MPGWFARNDSVPFCPGAKHLIEIIKEIERLISEKPAKTGIKAQKFRFSRMGQV
jgi:hypothetical protein